MKREKTMSQSITEIVSLGTGAGTSRFMLNQAD